MIPKQLLAENLDYLILVYSVSLKKLRKLNKWRRKQEVLGLKQPHYSTIWKSFPYKIGKNPGKTWHGTWEIHLARQLNDLLCAKAALRPFS